MLRLLIHDTVVKLDNLYRKNKKKSLFLTYMKKKKKSFTSEFIFKLKILIHFFGISFKTKNSFFFNVEYYICLNYVCKMYILTDIKLNYIKLRFIKKQTRIWNFF